MSIITIDEIKVIYHRNRTVRYTLNTLSVLIAVTLISGAFFGILLSSCYGGRAFCATEFKPEGINSAGLAIAFTGPFAIFPFKRTKKTLLLSLQLTSIVGLIVVAVFYVLIGP